MVKLFSKNSNLYDHNPPTSKTDRQTDRQTTCDGNAALCTKVHRAVKTQLTERSRITDKHRENHIKKHHEHWKRETKFIWECR